MNFDDALAYLNDHASYDTTGRIENPSIDVISALCAAMGDPQHAQPIIHVTGTNGKGSTVQVITRLLMAQGLVVGALTSPHLERVNERIDLLVREAETFRTDYRNELLKNPARHIFLALEKPIPFDDKSLETMKFCGWLLFGVSLGCCTVTAFVIGRQNRSVS